MMMQLLHRQRQRLRLLQQGTWSALNIYKLLVELLAGRKFKFFPGFIFLVIFINLSLFKTSYSSDLKTNNVYGVPGLINVPVAGSHDDGELVFTSSSFGPNLRNTLGFQALPNIYGVFRYAGIGDRKKLWHSKSGYTYWYRSFDLRIDVSKERSLIPSLTVGMQDIMGTGQYSGEYLVASKSFFEKIEATVGFGFGRFGSRNKISNGFRERGGYTTGRGGELRIKQLFGGDIGLLEALFIKHRLMILFSKLNTLQIILKMILNTQIKFRLSL